MDYMKLISFILLANSARAENQADNEVGRIFHEFTLMERKQVNLPLQFPVEFRERLARFSEEEIIRGLMTRFEEFDEMTNMTNHRYRDPTYIKFNDYLIKDVVPLRQMMAEKEQPREFFHLSGIAFALTKARGDDFIPSYFNTLFRDGRVARDQGEYTKNFAHDVSVLAYQKIISTLKELGAEYLSTRPEGLSHEDEVDHLARWLIANWPGCENFTLSDQNVPAILASRSTKRISGQSGSQSKESPALTKEAFKFRWPIIAAITRAPTLGMLDK